MRLYTVHVRRTADPLFTPDLGAVLVREGFNWAAFFFTWIWALACGLWIPAILLFAGQLVIALAAAAIGLDSSGQLAVTLGWHLLVGFTAEDLRRWNLHIRGYALAEIVAGEDRISAERRYFEHNPAMARPAWR